MNEVSAIKADYKYLLKFGDDSNDLFFLLDSNLNIVNTNEVTEKFFSYKKKALKGLSFSELLLEYPAVSFDLLIDELKTEPFCVKKKIDFDIKEKIYSVFFHILKFSLEKSSNENIFLVTGTVVGIQKKQIDANIQASIQKPATWSLDTIFENSHEVPTAFFRSLISGMPGIIFWKDINSIFKGCNSTFLTSFGFSSVDEIIGLTDADIGKKLQWRSETIKKFLEEDRKIILKKKTLRVENSVFFSNKKERILLTVKAPIFNENGEVIGVLGIAQDVTERRLHEIALKRAKEVAEEAQLLSSELDAIIRYAPDFIYWKDQNSIHLGCNDRFAEFAGLKSREEVIGKTDFDFPWKDQAESFQRDDTEVIQTGKPKLDIQDVMLNYVGETAIVITNKVPLRDKDGKTVGVFGIATEVTRLKETEEKLRKALLAAETASTAKSEFIANMSHDIRTPMTGILGMLQEVLHIAKETGDVLELASPLSVEKLFPRLKDFAGHTYKHMDIALESANELLRLSNEILELSRLESGKAEMVMEVFSLPEVVAHNHGLLQSVAMHKRLDFIVEIDERVPKYLKGSRQYLDRILLNILSNALKFTEAGHVKVGVTVVYSPSINVYQKGDKVTLQITIEDTGIGIPKEDFEKMFEHFSRLTSSYQGVYKGSGLGLYTVKRYVQAMAGRIDVESEVGKGSCFTLILPFTVEDSTNYRQSSPRLRTSLRVEPSKPPVSDCLVTKRLTPAMADVLIVEDNPTAALAEQMILERLSCQVDVAKNGAQALEKVNHHTYDLIFMDVGLPDISGLEVTQRIRALPDQEKSSVPIVALTGHAGDENQDACFQSGMNEILTKPPQPLALQSILEHWVWQRNAANEENMSHEIAREDLPIIDWIGCLTACFGDEVMAQSMLSGLAKDLEETQRILTEAYPTHDINRLREELHRCLGGILFLKLPQLEHAAKRFQTLLHVEPLNAEGVEHTYIAFQEALKKFWETYSRGDFKK